MHPIIDESSVTLNVIWEISKMNNTGLINRVSVFIQCGSLNKFPFSFAVKIDITTFNSKFTNLYIITNKVF